MPKIKSNRRIKAVLTINIYYKGENGNAKKFVGEMLSSGFADKIRKESGNLRYEYFFPAENEETVLLIDSWESSEALDLHHKSPIMDEIAWLREKYDLHMTVEKYESLNSSGDEKYIRR